jgi:hypothetical protein
MSIYGRWTRDTLGVPNASTRARMGHADVEELAADEAHIRGPLQPRRAVRITAECLDTRDIAAENVVVEHITGTVFSPAS